MTLVEYDKMLRKALNADDFETFKAFARDVIAPMNGFALPKDKVLEISMHKLRANVPGIPSHLKAASKKWLHEHNYNESMVQVGDMRVSHE